VNLLGFANGLTRPCVALPRHFPRDARDAFDFSRLAIGRTVCFQEAQHRSIQRIAMPAAKSVALGARTRTANPALRSIPRPNERGTLRCRCFNVGTNSVGDEQLVYSSFDKTPRLEACELQALSGEQTGR